MLNFTITLMAAAGIAALPVVGGALGGPAGLVTGGLAGLMVGESLKKSRPFSAAIAPIIGKLDKAATLDFRKFRTLLLSLKSKVRRLAHYSENLSWVDGMLNWIEHPPDDMAEIEVSPRVLIQDAWHRVEIALQYLGEDIGGEDRPISVATLVRYRKIDISLVQTIRELEAVRDRLLHSPQEHGATVGEAQQFNERVNLLVSVLSQPEK